jgi:hypothetical protein
VYCTREFEAEMDLVRAAEFISGESKIYPAFAEFVERDNQDWLAESWPDDYEE